MDIFNYYKTLFLFWIILFKLFNYYKNIVDNELSTIFKPYTIFNLLRKYI